MLPSKFYPTKALRHMLDAGTSCQAQRDATLLYQQVLVMVRPLARHGSRPQAQSIKHGSVKYGSTKQCSNSVVSVACSSRSSVCSEATRRGLGAALLRKPTKLGRLVAGIAEGIPIPLTVKIRSGESASKINVMQVSLPCPALPRPALPFHACTIKLHTQHHIALFNIA